MPTIDEIIRTDRPVSEIIAELKTKTICVPCWGTKGGKKGLQAEYDPKLHPVMDRSIYPDKIGDDGSLECVTRITYDLQRLAVKRMVELCNGIPVKRVYHPDNDRQKEIAKYMERIFQRNRIDSVNNERLMMLFASCEVFTLWYATEDRNVVYGFNSPLKIRCRNFSPMLGDELYPLFDEYGDMIAFSVGYKRKVGGKTVHYFDTYTNNHHYKWADGLTKNGTLVEDESISLMKIPGIYMFRPTPIWEDTSRIVFETEWAVSRDGNYLRKNSKPLFVVFADEQVNYGKEKDENSEFKSILQYPKGSTAAYVTWQQAVDNLKFFITELRQAFFTQLQLPDWSYESMKANPMSGEARKQLFIDAQLKVKDESGRLLEFFDREINVVKTFVIAALGEEYRKDVESLQVDTVITPYTITEEKDTITNLVTANGGKPIMSQRESIEAYGRSEDVDKTLREIIEESELSSFDLTK